MLFNIGYNVENMKSCRLRYTSASSYDDIETVYKLKVTNIFRQFFIHIVV